VEIEPPVLPRHRWEVSHSYIRAGALDGLVAAVSTSRKTRTRVLRVVGQFDVGVLFWTDSTSQKAHECFEPLASYGATHAGVYP
jgi:hypothetical protein